MSGRSRATDLEAANAFAFVLALVAIVLLTGAVAFHGASAGSDDAPPLVSS